MPTFGAPAQTPGWGETLWNSLKGIPQALGPRSAEAYVLPMDSRASLAMEAMRTGQTPTGQEGPFLDIPPQKRAMYKHIFDAAHARPETVLVGMPETWRAPEDSVGAYWGSAGPGVAPQIDVRQLSYVPTKTPEEGVAMYSPTPVAIGPTLPTPMISPASQPMQETLAHELMHFLPDMEVHDAFKRAPAQGAAFLDLTRERRAPTERVQQAFGGAEPQHEMLKYLFGRAHMPMIYGAKEQQTGLGPRSGVMTPEGLALYEAYLRKIFPPGPVRDQVLSGLGMRP